MRTQILFLLSLLCLPLFADWTDLDPESFSMQGPPSKGSAAYKRDFKVLLELQESRTDEECALSQSQKAPTFRALFGSSELLSSKEMKTVEPLLNKTLKLAERITNHFKEEYMRPRPYNVDPQIQPCVDKPGGSKAYPSSHASMSTLGACVLAQIYPKRAEKLIDYAKFLSILRVKVGVHHPSDVEAGQELAEEICERISALKDFKAEIAEFK